MLCLHPSVQASNNVAIAPDTIAIDKAKAMVALNFDIKSFQKSEIYAKCVIKKNIIFYIKGK